MSAPRIRWTIGLVAILAVVQAGCGRPTPDADETPVTYPVTVRGAVADTVFGKRVTDPYRWLENDPRTDANVAAWVAVQRQTTSTYLDALDGRNGFRRSLTLANDYERVGAPQKKAGRYFYTRKDGDRDQAALWVRDRTGGDRMLIDPAAWSRDGSAGLAEWQASDDGARLAYGVSIGGNDWRTIRVIDVATGRLLADEVKWARFTQIAWKRDGSGFFYSRYPTPKAGEEDGSGLTNHAVYFHRIGTPQAQDELFYSTPNQPDRMNSVGRTTDGRFAVAYSSADLVRADITIMDMQSRDGSFRKLIENPRNRWSVVGNVGSTLYLMTDDNAARQKIVSVDMTAATPAFRDVVPEQDANMTAASIVGDRLMVSYLVDAKSEVRRYKLDGTTDGVLRLPGIGSVSALAGEGGDPEGFFVFASFNQPNTVYRFDSSTNAQSVWVNPKSEADLKSIIVEQVFYASRDGTRIPMFIVRRKDVTGPAPTVLTAYGAFGIASPPAYSAMFTGWLLQGGVIAMPAVRGGGEYGSAWHDAGRRDKKQNGFDDFIAAAEYLHANDIASRDGITAYGASAGGLLVGAVVNQRPDLFGAALPAVGVMDMLRYDKFTGGRLWLGEYGDPKIESEYNTLLAYSPLHNIRSTARYPAILVTTGEADNRVVPAHSFKYAAALQAANLGPRPRLLRVDARAGHGIGKPTTQMVEEAVDMWAFAAYWTGLVVR